MYNPEVNDFVTNYLSNEFFGRSPYRGSSKMDVEDKEKLQKIRENALNAFKEAPNNYRTQRQLFMDYFPQKAFTGQYETDYELYLSKLPIEKFATVWLYIMYLSFEFITLSSLRQIIFIFSFLSSFSPSSSSPPCRAATTAAVCPSRVSLRSATVSRRSSPPSTPRSSTRSAVSSTTPRLPRALMVWSAHTHTHTHIHTYIHMVAWTEFGLCFGHSERNNTSSF